MGSANRPMQVSQSFPGIIVPQRWSQSIQNIAMMCSDADVISKFRRFPVNKPLFFTIGLHTTRELCFSGDRKY